MEPYTAAMQDVEGEEELEGEFEQNEPHPPPLKRNTPSLGEKEELLRYVYLRRNDKSPLDATGLGADDLSFFVCSKLSCLRSLRKKDGKIAQISSNTPTRKVLA